MNQAPDPFTRPGPRCSSRVSACVTIACTISAAGITLRMMPIASPTKMPALAASPFAIPAIVLLVVLAFCRAYERRYLFVGSDEYQRVIRGADVSGDRMRLGEALLYE